MFDFEKPHFTVCNISDDDHYGKFVFEPLERGYGLTIGNSLRRIMLSSLPGSAITAVKIDGVLHEFSTVKGVKEDVTEIVMNLKSVHIKDISDNNETKYITLDMKGEGVVTAADIKLSQDLIITNPEQVIATLAGGKDSRLTMEMAVTKGRGYVGAEKAKTEEYLGWIPVDALYTPVTRVNSIVEDTRVGQVTDFNKLTLEVWTNGTMSPVDAVALAAKVMTAHLEEFVNLSAIAQKAEVMQENCPEEEEVEEDMRIEELCLSARPSNALRRSGINTVNELCRLKESEIANLKNLGKNSLDEILEKLKEFGRSLRPEDEI